MDYKTLKDYKMRMVLIIAILGSCVSPINGSENSYNLQSQDLYLNNPIITHSIFFHKDAFDIDLIKQNLVWWTFFCQREGFSKTSAYVFNNTAQTVPINSSIVFNNTGLLYGIEFTPPSSTLTVVSGGIYLASFYVCTLEKNQFGISINGEDPELSTIYSSDASYNPTMGNTVISVNDGDTVEIKNFISSSDVTLPEKLGGELPAINASLLLVRVK